MFSSVDCKPFSLADFVVGHIPILMNFSQLQLASGVKYFAYTVGGCSHKSCVSFELQLEF